jgi:molybdopterin-guanine dinucleotide biosynthesis protein
MNSAEMESAQDDKPDSPPLIGVVGVCASGKSTLIARLKERGYRAKHIAQEHSYVKDMWKRLTHPDVLIFLDASHPVTLQRRRLDWTEADWAEQQRRLIHAREHTDFYLDTDELTIEQVLEAVIRFIETSKG